MQRAGDHVHHRPYRYPRDRALLPRSRAQVRGFCLGGGARRAVLGDFETILKRLDHAADRPFDRLHAKCVGQDGEHERIRDRAHCVESVLARTEKAGFSRRRM